MYRMVVTIKRKGGGTRRKYPVTAKMLKQVKRLRLSNDEDAVATRLKAELSPKDAVPVYCGCNHAWHFLLRGGEWLAHDGRG